jgi:type I restriction enzyme S subunit
MYGGTKQGLSLDDVKNYLLVLPPRKEQELLVQLIEEETHKVTLTIDRTRHKISLLREYRSRLIADIVTGKLDVREAAANLPEETDETETFDDALAEDEELENNEIEDDQAGEFEEEVLA